MARDAGLARRVHDAGSSRAPSRGTLETWLTLRSVRTLALRARQQTATATRLAAALEPRAPRVWHPSLASHPGHALAARRMRGPGPMLSIELATEQQARDVPAALRLFRNATSLGGIESLIEWRPRVDAAAPPTLLRLSVGLEDAEDLVADLRAGLDAVQGR